jgi:hypothetical protein
VSRAAARGEAPGLELDAVTGTSLDKGVELDALAKLASDATPFSHKVRERPGTHKLRSSSQDSISGNCSV